MAVSSIGARLVLSRWDACPALVPRKMQCPEEEEEEEKVTDCESEHPAGAESLISRVHFSLSFEMITETTLILVLPWSCWSTDHATQSLMST